MRNQQSKIHLSKAYNIPFHQSTLTEGEVTAVQEAVSNGNWIKESEHSKQFFKKYYPDSTSFFTNSCSSSLEMAIRILGIGAGDEVIIPGFGYVAVANAIVNNGWPRGSAQVDVERLGEQVAKNQRR